MKAVVGQAYVLTNSPSMFKAWIGHTFIITSVTNEEISLEEKDSSGYGYACIAVTPEEFPVYFRLDVPIQKKEEKKATKKCKAGKWSEWKTFKLYGVTYAFKENGKDVIVRSGGYRGCSKCHPEDKFDLEYGLRMAISRLVKNKNAARKAQEEYLAKRRTDRGHKASMDAEDVFKKLLDVW